jgi:hypothetical protein
VVPNSVLSDKTAIAVDARDDSPHRGTVYFVWCEGMKHLAFSRSLDGGRTGERAVLLGEPSGHLNAQILIGPGGVVHLVWTLAFWIDAEADREHVDTAIFHASSTDGGATVSEPTVIARHGGADRLGVLDATCSASGELLVVWSEAATSEVERGRQAPHALRFVHSPDGERWSSPASLVEVPGVAHGLPAAASTDGAWHVLSYDATDRGLAVRIYSAPHGDLTFRPTHELAARSIGFDDVYLHGSYQLRGAHDIVNVGDYVGLAGSRDRLAVAITLPETDDPQSEQVVYAGTVDV